MLKVDEKLVELLKKGSTLGKLRNKSQLCDSELVDHIRRLENRGYVIKRIFHDYGVNFKISDKPNQVLQDNVKIDANAMFSFIVISDTHLGNVYENIDMLNKTYQYAKSQGIKYVFHLGDLVEGPPIDREKQDDIHNRTKRKDLLDQINFVTRHYPKINNIHTLFILGNHDERCLKEGIDIAVPIEKRRLDMHFLGYKNSKMMIGNTSVLLHHPYTLIKSDKYDSELQDLYYQNDFDLILRGHTHQNSIYKNEYDSVVVEVPACYDSPNRVYTGAYHITLNQQNLDLTSLILNGSVHPFSKVSYQLRTKIKEKELIKAPPMSQIDKFNNRYKLK